MAVITVRDLLEPLIRLGIFDQHLQEEVAVTVRKLALPSAAPTFREPIAATQ